MNPYGPARQLVLRTLNQKMEKLRALKAELLNDKRLVRVREWQVRRAEKGLGIES